MDVYYTLLSWKSVGSCPTQIGQCGIYKHTTVCRRSKTNQQELIYASNGLPFSMGIISRPVNGLVTSTQNVKTVSLSSPEPVQHHPPVEVTSHVINSPTTSLKEETPIPQNGLSGSLPQPIPFSEILLVLLR